MLKSSLATNKAPSSYRETIDMLYNSNTFAMLHNTVLIDFRRAALASHLSQIRSLHIHFQFRELSQHGSLYAGADDLLCPWSIETFTTSASSPSIARAIQSLPNLERLSVFIQGPLTTESTYRRILWSLRSIRHDMKSLNFMMVRFPRPFPNHGYQMRTTRWRNQDPRDLVEEVLRWEEELNGFRIVQPTVELAQDVYDMADSDIESEWRVGNIYMECNGVENGFATRSYAVLRPEKETETYRPDLEAEPNCYLKLPRIPVIEHEDPDDLYGSGYRALNWPPRLDGEA